MRRCGGGDSGGGSRVLGAAGCGRGSACSPDGRGERGARGPGRGTVRTERRLPLSGSQGHPGLNPSYQGEDRQEYSAKQPMLDIFQAPIKWEVF